MQVVLLKLLSWLGQKLIAAAVIVLIALAGYGLWLFLQEEGMLEKSRLARLQETIVQRDQLLAAKNAVEQRIGSIRAEIEAQKARVKQAEKVIASLHELESWWKSWWPWSKQKEQQSANAEQLKKMEALKVEATGKWAELQRTVTEVIWQKEGIENALIRVNADIGHLEASRSRARHYALLAWDRTKWWVGIALASYFLGPTLWALVMYYGFGPFVNRGQPIKLGAEPAALPEVGQSRVSVEVVLRPGEILRIREKFLQASDEGLGRRTRFVLDWQIPFTSIACGLVELVEMHHTHAQGEYRVTLSNGDDPHIEMALVEVPAGSSLVLRPTFLAGVVQRENERIAIRRHWRLFHWQAWVTGQFRFFEFVGPCRLAVAGSRGVRAELLADREGVAAPARRTNQDATIGFTPNLEYRPVRAETFWSYYRGMNPLFDDLFSGRGLFVLQETSSDGAAAKVGKFWSSVWSGVLKVFGL
jgi:hypothetical protein